MANTQRDEGERQGRRRKCGPAGQGSHSGCRPGCRGGVESPRDGGQEPQRPRQFGPRFWLFLLGLLDDLPFLPTGTGPARCGRPPSTPRVHLRLSENGSVKPSFVMRPLAMVVTNLRTERVEEADGPPRLTVEATWGPDGSVHIEFHLRPCIDAKRSTELANLWQTAIEGLGPATGPGLDPACAAGLGWSPPPESNRRPQSLPLMLGWFTSLCTASLTHATEQVKGAAGDRVVGWREVACSAVSGKSLARARHGSSWTLRLPSSGASPADWHLRCSAVLG